jgi:hypothetical protein
MLHPDKIAVQPSPPTARNFQDALLNVREFGPLSSAIPQVKVCEAGFGSWLFVQRNQPTVFNLKRLLVTRIR